MRIFGTGQQQRNFLHISDLAQYYEAAIFCPEPERLKGEVLNVAGPKTATISEVAELIKKLLAEKHGIEVKIKHEDEGKIRKHEVYDFPISYEKARKTLGVEPKISLEEGLEIELERALRTIKAR